MKSKKLILCLVCGLFIQACTSKEEIKEIENKKIIDEEIRNYISDRKNLLEEKSNKVFGIGLDSSYKDLQILLNPSLSSSTSATYEDGLENSNFPMDATDEKLEKVSPLNDFTESYLFKKSINSFEENNFNYKIQPPKPSYPFNSYEAKISKKYGVCSLLGTYNFDNEYSDQLDMGLARSSFYGKANDIANILNHKYGSQEFQLNPIDPFDQAQSNGRVMGKWITRDMQILLTGFIFEHNNGKPYENIQIEYISNNLECHEDVKRSLDDELKNESNEKIEKQKTKNLNDSSL
ncbi:hypothetical protein [Acinetobacter sp. CIP 102136]|uniref:hypothetical protein n=1 Tax=Acinetobacter sp. CIP 102136 TaxID=1144665 RepID=UPI0002CEE622|nr:hypothetical protein [Acinetobacter sp. CIP 102136]ENX25624.1 hypothetical protein F893_00109 [Acinetobacter sp. CIP 102136]